MQSRVRKKIDTISEEFSDDNRRLTCYPGIGSDELSACSQRHVFSNHQLVFQSAGLLSFLGVVLAGFILLAEECPDEILGSFIKIIKKV